MPHTAHVTPKTNRRPNPSNNKRQQPVFLLYRPTLQNRKHVPATTEQVNRDAPISIRIPIIYLRKTTCESKEERFLGKPVGIF